MLHSLKRYTHVSISNSLVVCLLLFFSVSPISANADVIVVVNKDMPIESISRIELKQIYLGRLNTLPGSQHHLQPIDQSERSNVFKVFYSEVVGFYGVKLQRYRARFLFSGKGRLPESAGSSEAILERVRKDPTAIGYVDVEIDIADTEVKEVFRLPHRSPASEFDAGEKAKVTE